MSKDKPPQADWLYLEYPNAIKEGNLEGAWNLETQYFAICEEIGSKKRASKKT